MRILDEAVEDAVKLSHRYITGPPAARQVGQPARHRLRPVAMGQSSDAAGRRGLAQREIEQLEVEIGILEREAVTGAEHDQRLAELKTKKENAEKQLAELEERWEEEKQLVERDPRDARQARRSTLGACAKDGKSDERRSPPPERDRVEIAAHRVGPA